MGNTIDIYRDSQLIVTVDIDENTVFNEKLQGTKTITCPVSAPTILQIQEGDYILHKEEVFRIHILPEFSKDSTSLAKKYQIVFEAEFYQLLDEFVLDSEGRADFPYYATAADHLQLIINNANRTGSGWVVGEVDGTEAQNIDYSWTYVRTALDDIATAFGLEYQFTGKTIRMVKSLGRNTGLSFEMGRGKGLHGLKRVPDTSKSVINRVFAVGGTKNITSTYRGGTEKSLIIEGRYIETPGVTIGTERLKEGKYENENIYPQFKGSVTACTILKALDGTAVSMTITDPTIDFDIIAYKQGDVNPKLSFLTGILAGVDFEILSYNATTHTITAKANTDTNGYLTPNDSQYPEVGHKFTMYDLGMPPAYVAKAEADLLAAAIIYLNDNKNQRLIFTCDPDEKYLRDNAIDLRVGDLATVVEPDIDTNTILRFVEISYPLVNTFNVSATIGGDIIYDRVVKLFADVQATHQQLIAVDRRSEQLAKRGVQELRILQSSIFDTDGLIKSGSINVPVLEAALGIFGQKSQDFRLSLVFITDNYNADPNSVAISSGELIHREISNPGDQNVWQLQPIVQSGLVPASLYYVYCKCSTLTQAGSFVITTDQITYNSLPGYFMFLAGVIYPVIQGYRNSDFTNGIADINGNRLKIGKIVSRDGLTGFDLDNSTIFGRIRFKNTAGQLTDVATLQNQVDNIDAVTEQELSAAISQANATAAAIAQSKVDVAKAVTLSQASTDAQAKADAAYNNSLAASNAYSNNIGSAAAADASNKATAAYNNAQAAADAKYNALTGQLGNMAFRSVQAAAGYGITTIDNGSVITFLVDAAYIRSNVIDVGYITGLNLNFVQGSIGGIVINQNGILASNGTFYINNQGQLYCTQATVSGTINATSGVIGGFNISSSQISSGGFLLDPVSRMMSFIDTSNGMVASVVGSLNADLIGYGVSPGVFVNERNQFVSKNTALTISAKNGGNGNYAIDIINGDILVHGKKGYTGYNQAPGNNLFDKYEAGIYLGRGTGAW